MENIKKIKNTDDGNDDFDPDITMNNTEKNTKNTVEKRTTYKSFKTEIPDDKLVFTNLDYLTTIKDLSSQSIKSNTEEIESDTYEEEEEEEYE